MKHSNGWWKNENRLQENKKRKREREREREREKEGGREGGRKREKELLIKGAL